MARLMKDSGVKWIKDIPVQWETRRIKHSFSVVAGATPKCEIAEFWDGDIIWITPADYKTNEMFVSTGRRNLTKAGYDSCGTTIVPANSIIFSKRAPIGSVTINRVPLCTNQGCLACVPFQDVSIKFFYYAMSIFTEEFNLFGSGTTFKEISADSFRNFILPFPSLTEQSQIAAYLDHMRAEIDSVIADTQRTIEEYKALKQSIITEAVTKGVRGKRAIKDSGIEWVRELPADWSVIPSKHLFRNSDERKHEFDVLLTASQKHGIISQQEYMERENAKVVLANKGLEGWKHVEPFDFIISLRSFQGGLEMSETTGCITWHYIVLKPCKPINSYYFKWLFKSELYIKALQRTCNFIRDGQDLRYSNFIQVPLFQPSLDEQEEIAVYLNTKCSEIDSLIAAKETLLSELESYKKSLIYEYVTGKKEVPACL